MIKCKDAVDRLWAYLDQRLDDQPQRELQEHLGVCVHCCGELEFAKQVREKLTGTEAAMPSDTRERVEALLKGLGS